MNMNEFQQTECVFLLRTGKTVSKIDRVLHNSDWYVISMYDINDHGEPVDIRTSLTSGAGAQEYINDLLENGACDELFD